MGTRKPVVVKKPAVKKPAVKKPAPVVLQREYPVVSFQELGDIFDAARDMCGAGDPAEYDDAVASVDLARQRLFAELTRARNAKAPGKSRR